jgi:hypothetical protein
MDAKDLKLTRLVPGAIVVLAAIVLITLVGYKLNFSKSKNETGPDILAPDEDIRLEVSSDISVHAAEPFDYQVRVLYRPDKVSPDFRQLLRDVNFAPFEQRHKTRTRIVENKGNGLIHKYVLSYTIVGIDVLPGSPYELEEVSISYKNVGSNSMEIINHESVSVLIAPYYEGNPLDMMLEPAKGPVDDNRILVLSLLAGCLLLFLLLCGTLLRKVIIKPDISPRALADQLRDRFNEIKASANDRRSKLIEYEKLILSIFKSYGKRAAIGFWLAADSDDGSSWSRMETAIKPAIEYAYRTTGPGDPDLRSVESNFEQFYLDVESQVDNERQAMLMELQGTVGQRIRRNRFGMSAVVVSLVIAMIFLYLIINQDIWADQDARVFNTWLNSLPERLMVEDAQHGLNNLDIEMLGHISDEQRVLEKLQSDSLRSAYLYNYGTLATNIYKSILLNPPQDEEEEVPEPPTFEFPLQLMANAARFNPDDEDVRRNLEIIIGLKESQKKEESGDIQGELGPPTPGFSRDLNPRLF